MCAYGVGLGSGVLGGGGVCVRTVVVLESCRYVLVCLVPLNGQLLPSPVPVLFDLVYATK